MPTQARVPARPWGTRKRSSRLEAAVSGREPLHLDDGVSRELVHDPLTMRLDSASRDEQLRRDLVVAMATDQELEDFALALRESSERTLGDTVELALNCVA